MIPKFRAWDKINKEINPVLALDWTELEEELAVFLPMSKKSMIAVSSENVILMQSTGLKDKNGVEIFEGDVVIVEVDEIIRPVVKYIDGIFCLMSDDTCLGYLSEYYQVSEVIGNIYENPELVEVE